MYIVPLREPHTLWVQINNRRVPVFFGDPSQRGSTQLLGSQNGKTDGRKRHRILPAWFQLNLPQLFFRHTRWFVIFVTLESLVSHCIILHFIASYCITYCILLDFVAFYCIILHFIASYCITYCILLDFVAFCCIILHFIASTECSAMQYNAIQILVMQLFEMDLKRNYTKRTSLCLFTARIRNARKYRTCLRSKAIESLFRNSFKF